VPFSITRDVPPEQATPGVNGPVTRENVETGSNVFDIRGMIADLEASPGARKRT